MLELLPISVGFGLVVSLMFTELFGLAAGGMVVPGYIALYLTKPLHVLTTVAAGLATFFIVHALSSVVIIFGRRRTVMMILVGYMLGMGIRTLLGGTVTPDADGFTVIGFIIPGLIGIWIDRQGMVETLTSLLIASTVVRLLLILFLGKELIQ